MPTGCRRPLRDVEEDVMAVLKKGARITGADRNKLAGDLKKQYDKGKSIRELADSHGRSYGFVHRVLSESGVTLRGRGGATRAKAKGK
jgi:predicted transcriptional regulator